MANDLYSFTVVDSGGQTVNLDTYRGKVVLVVNVASKCGFTPQYKGLEELYQKFKDKGLIILGFPCNQFGAQEPGTNQEIQSFCEINYGVTFPVFGKVDVNGDQTTPLFQWLKSAAPGIFGTELVKWNFTKFLIGKDGQVLKRFAPKEEPKDLATEIEAALV
jgi:glutathione peroxidase